MDKTPMGEGHDMADGLHIFFYEKKGRVQASMDDQAHGKAQGGKGAQP